MLNMPNDGHIVVLDERRDVIKGVRCHVGPEIRYIPRGEGMTVECPSKLA
jgi:hypothetical protein